MTERLTGISGSMFSGKTEELIRFITRAEYAGKKIQIFKPAIDKRWGKEDYIKSHSGAQHEAIPLPSAPELFEYLKQDTRMVVIDEVQFFDKKIVGVVERLLEYDIEVVFAGIPLDFRGEPFGQMPVLLAKADKVVRLTAICTHKDSEGGICGAEATRTQRLIDGKPADYGDPVILIGAKESYAARCPTHHIVPGRPVRPL